MNKSLKKWIKESIKQALTENLREVPTEDTILTQFNIRSFVESVKNNTLKQIVKEILLIAENLKDLTDNPTQKEIIDIKSKIKNKPSFLSLKNSPLTKNLTIKIDEALQDINNKLDVRKDPSSLVGKATETHNDLVNLATIIINNQNNLGFMTMALQKVLNLGIKDHPDRPSRHGPRCPRCGRTTPSGSKFCPFDGTPLN
jgi:hypothetical protein